MIQGLPMPLIQVKADLSNEICQIINSLFQENEITKKLYNNIMNSIQL